jgi:anti-anti-sigma factor
MVISSRTPEGTPNRCPVCGAHLKIESSEPAGDAPCPRCGHLLWFTWEDRGDLQVIKPTGRILEAESLESLLNAVTVRAGVTFALDLSDVQYMPSDALSKLISLRKKLGKEGAKLRLQSLHPDLREVFRLCRLDQVFETEE